MKTLGSVAAVVAAMRDELAAELERLEREAATRLDALTSEGESVPIPERDASLNAAAWRAAEVRAEAEWRATREDLQDRERWLDEVLALGRRTLQKGMDADDVRAWMGDLVAEAAENLPPGECRVVVSETALPLLDAKWTATVEARTGRRLRAEPGTVTSGCIVRLVEQPVAYDNSGDARERRSAAVWRVALARLYERVTDEAARRPRAQASARSGAGA